MVKTLKICPQCLRHPVYMYGVDERQEVWERQWPALAIDDVDGHEQCNHGFVAAVSPLLVSGFGLVAVAAHPMT